MNQTKLAVAFAAGCSSLAILACLVVIPRLFVVINEIHDEIFDGVAVFRVYARSMLIG